jgi:hypothetical protein
VHVPRRIIAERMIVNRDGSPPLERRMFVFDGRVRVIQTTVAVGTKLRSLAYHDRDWQRLPWRGRNVPDPQPVPRPERLDALIALAERLGRGLDHVRVDLYDADDRIYVGELTLYSWSGFMRFEGAERDRVLGSYWRLRWPACRAIAACLLRSRDIPQVLRQ